MSMFSRQLHQRLDGEEEHELSVCVLSSFYRDLRHLINWKGWSEEEGLRYVLAAGHRAIAGWKTPQKMLDEMTEDEKLKFLQDRLASLESAYSTVKFQAYQVMTQNDALEMNLRGLMPQLEAARQRAIDLEAEVLRLRRLVPPEYRQGEVLVREPEPQEPEGWRLSDRIRHLFGGREG